MCALFDISSLIAGGPATRACSRTSNLVFNFPTAPRGQSDARGRGGFVRRGEASRRRTRRCLWLTLTLALDRAKERSSSALVAADRQTAESVCGCAGALVRWCAGALVLLVHGTQLGTLRPYLPCLSCLPIYTTMTRTGLAGPWSSAGHGPGPCFLPPSSTVHSSPQGRARCSYQNGRGRPCMDSKTTSQLHLWCPSP